MDIINIHELNLYITYFHESSLKGEPTTWTVGAMTSSMLGLIFIYYTTIKF